MYLERTFHSIGQGAFYTEQFFDQNNNTQLSLVFDCGTLTSPRYGLLKESISLSRLHDSIDAVFISHLHSDHINGLRLLLKMREIKNLSRISHVDLNERVFSEAGDKTSYLTYNTPYEYKSQWCFKHRNANNRARLRNHTDPAVGSRRPETRPYRRNRRNGGQERDMGRCPVRRLSRTGRRDAGIRSSLRV